MSYKINIPLVGGDGTRPFELIDSAGNMTVDEVHTELDFRQLFQGETSGYFAGGQGSSTLANHVEKYPFSSDANAADVGNLLSSSYNQAGGSSSPSHGYVIGAYPKINVIQKFSFSVDGNSTDVGDLTQGRDAFSTGTSETHAYAASGSLYPPFSAYSNVIDKFPFSSDANATDVGDTVIAGHYWADGCSSSTHGYALGGTDPGAPPNSYSLMEKYPFASDANSTDVGDLYSPVSVLASCSSSTTEGFVAPGIQDKMVKFSFATDASSEFSVQQVGLGGGAYGNAKTGTSSTTHGYSAGGNWDYPANYSNVIQKYAYAQGSGNSVDVGDLTEAKAKGAGNIMV